MTSNEITFCFRKEPNSLTPHFNDALQGTTPLAVNNKKITAIVTHTLNKLIKKDAVKYKNAILSLSNFSVTFTYNPDKQSSLKIVSSDEGIVIHLKKLSENATALLNSIPQNQPEVISASLPTQPKIVTVETTEPPLQPIAQPTLQVASSSETTTATSTTPMVVIPKKATLETIEPTLQPIVQPTIQAKTTTATSTTPIVVSPQTIKKQLISATMQVQFMNTMIKRSAESEEEFFGTYLMNRIFGDMDSCEFDENTLEFTLNFPQKRDIKLDKLPVDLSGLLVKAQGATLSIAKQVKGKFNEGNISFQTGSLKLNWAWSSAELSGISESRNDGIVSLQGSYCYVSGQETVSAQDFVDLIECNLPKY